MTKKARVGTTEKTNPEEPAFGLGVRISLFESVATRLSLMDESQKRLAYFLLEIVGSLLEGDRVSGKRLVQLMRVVTAQPSAVKPERSRRA